MEEKITTREEEKSQKPAESQPQKVPPKSLSAKNCLVCFCLFNENEKKPRTIPCGHTFCSECITSTISDLIFTCPSCRKTYNAPSANTFPISYIALDLISEMMTGNTDEVSEDSMKSSNPISRRLKSQITEAIGVVESLSCEGFSLRSQLQLYASQLDKWNSDHQQFTSQLDDMVREINKEKTRIETSLEEEVMVRTEMEQTADTLKRQDKTLKILEDLEKVHLSSENFEEWIKTTDESFPNMELITKSQLLRKQYQMGPVNPSASVVEEEEQEEECARASLSPNQGTSLDEKCLTSSMTIQEKIKSALLSISHGRSVKAVQTQCNSLESKAIQTDCQDSFDLLLKPEDAVDKKRLLDHLLLGRQFLALQEEEESGKKRFARLSLDRKQRVLLHVLSEEVIHPNGSPSIIKYEEILRHVPCTTSRRTFLEFGVDGASIGRVVISLIDEGNLTENFQILCLGREQEITYRHSNILGVCNKGTKSEFIHLGDYERNDGSGGRGVVSGVDWKKERKRDIYKRTHTEAGFVWGWIDDSGAKVSQFIINTRDRNAIYSVPCFGKVVEGLDVIRDIADRYNNKNIKKVKIIDCGVVLSI